MSFVSQVLGGGRTTKSIVNSFSSAGYAAQNVDSVTISNNGAKVVLSGAMTANTLKTVFSKTDGACEMTQFGIATVDSTTRTLRVKITVDGTVAYDYTSANIVNSGYGMCAAGYAKLSYNVPLGVIRSNSSLVIEIASSLTETDKLYIGYAYQELF